MPCNCENTVLISCDGYTYRQCQSCGTEHDFMVTHGRKDRQAEIILHEQTMSRIRDNVAHLCDGPLTAFVHLCRVMEMVAAGSITPDAAANYVVESVIPNDDNQEPETSPYLDAAEYYYGIGGQTP